MSDRLQIEAFVNSTCELSQPLPIFIAVYSLSNGNPCKGCAYDDHVSGGCKAKRSLFAKPAVAQSPQEPQETVREMANRLGISLSEARRRRREVGAT